MSLKRARTSGARAEHSLHSISGVRAGDRRPDVDCTRGAGGDDVPRRVEHVDRGDGGQQGVHQLCDDGHATLRTSGAVHTAQGGER